MNTQLNTPETPTPSTDSASNPWKIFGIGVIALALIAGVATFGYLLGVADENSDPATTETPMSAPAATEVASTVSLPPVTNAPTTTDCADSADCWVKTLLEEIAWIEQQTSEMAALIRGWDESTGFTATQEALDRAWATHGDSTDHRRACDAITDAEEDIIVARTLYISAARSYWVDLEKNRERLSDGWSDLDADDPVRFAASVALSNVESVWEVFAGGPVLSHQGFKAWFTLETGYGFPGDGAVHGRSTAIMCGLAARADAADG